MNHEENIRVTENVDNAERPNENVDETKRFSQREIKRILHKISKLSSIEHRGIYKILVQNNLAYTHNNNGLFISMSTIPHSVIAEIEKFVNFCMLNNVELDAHEKKMNECKYNQFYKVSWGPQKTDSGEVPENIAYDNHNSIGNAENDKGDIKNNNMHCQDNSLTESLTDRDFENSVYNTYIDKSRHYVSSYGVEFNNLGESQNEPIKKGSILRSKSFKSGDGSPKRKGRSEKGEEVEEVENEDAADNEDEKSTEYTGYYKRTRNDWTNLLDTGLLKTQDPDGTLDKYVHHIEDAVECIHKKRMNMKYMNAKKKFARKINNEKKVEQEIMNTLMYENYVLWSTLQKFESSYTYFSDINRVLLYNLTFLYLTAFQNES